MISQNRSFLRAHMGVYSINQIHLRNPWVTALWSALFPGFGHVLLCRLLKAWYLIIWELVVNLQCHLNSAIIYSFTGHFQMAKEVVNTRWLILYAPVYIYAIFDGYRTTVDLNKCYILADREDAKIPKFAINTLEINYLDKKNPWVPAFWSLLMPGIGHLSNNRIPSGIFQLTWWIVVSYYSHVLQAIQFTATGHFSQAVHVINSEWLLFLPSAYVFSFYDSYNATVENNKLFEKEQSRFLRETYQDFNFKMPL